MNPDDMTDDQFMRMICIAIAAVSRINSTPKGLMDTADSIATYIDNGGFE